MGEQRLRRGGGGKQTNKTDGDNLNAVRDDAELYCATGSLW